MKFILLFTFLTFLGAAKASPIAYKSLTLKPMPIKLQQFFKEGFQRASLYRKFLGATGSEVLGVNMLFSDKFFVSKIAIKYDVQGNFELGKTYAYKKWNVYHFKLKNKQAAVFYQNVDSATIKAAIAFSLEEIASTAKKSPLLRAIPKAYASECARPSFLPQVNLDSSVAQGASSSLLGNCLENMGSGAAEDSIIGDLGNIYKSLKKEGSLLLESPSKRLGDYVSFMGEGMDKLWSFTRTLSRMMYDPAFGSEILGKKFGEIGRFFGETYESIKGMPLETKMDIICNFIGAIGVDALIAALSAGAASGKLGVTLAKLLIKLKKVAAAVGKGLNLPFKAFAALGESSLQKLNKLLDEGNADLISKKLRGVDCAI